MALLVIVVVLGLPFVSAIVTREGVGNAWRRAGVEARAKRRRARRGTREVRVVNRVKVRKG